MAPWGRGLPDGPAEVAFRTGGLLKLARHLIARGGAVEIMNPAELRQIICREFGASLVGLGDA